MVGMGENDAEFQHVLLTDHGMGENGMGKNPVSRKVKTEPVNWGN